MALLTSTPWQTAPLLVLERGIDPALLNDLTTCTSIARHHPRTFQGVLDETLRKSDYTEIPDDLEERLYLQLKIALEHHFDTRISRIPEQRAVAYRYGPGVGFVAHHDEVTDIERERARANGQPIVGGDITVVTWLSGPDDYIGGALFFDNPTRELRPLVGAVAAFPATRDYMHGVRPIESGERTTVILRVAVTD